MRKQMLLVTLPVCLAIVAAGAWLANAGDLNPPAGPVTPTMLTLDDLASAIQSISGGDARTDVLTLPGSASALHVIDQPGSYYLSGNITGVSGKNGIEITASNVTLDLSGFALVGVVGSLTAVSAAGTHHNISNGVVRQWDAGGIASGSDSRFINLTLSFNEGGTGLACGDRCQVIQCTIAGTQGGGGIVAGLYSGLVRCIAEDNELAGLDIGNGSIIDSCTARGNGGNGISIGSDSIVDRCVARDNTLRGIYASSDAVVTRSIAMNNGTEGISVSAGVLRDCESSDNGSHGIKVSGSTIVINNICEGNGGSGIRSTSHKNRIESNHVTNNTSCGIELTGNDNFIIKNSATGNTTNYCIDSPDNHFGTIVTPSGGPFSNSNPWANFSWAEG